MEQLKKCPFCGGKAHYYSLGNCTHIVRCKKCLCAIGNVYKTKEEAIAAWNTRKPMERIVERLEELRMAEYDDSDEEPVYTDAEDIFDDGVSSGKFKAYHEAIKIVKEET